jgi:hypothetical protein
MNLFDSTFLTTDPLVVFTGLCSPIGMSISERVVDFARNHNKDWLLNSIAYQFEIEVEQ